MASRYHWLTPGIDTNFALGQPTAQCFAASIPAGGIVKRFQLRNCLFHAKNFSNTFTNVFGLSIDMTVQFTSGPNNGRIIYKGKRDIPLQYGINVGSISGVYTGSLDSTSAAHMAWPPARPRISSSATSWCRTRSTAMTTTSVSGRSSSACCTTSDLSCPVPVAGGVRGGSLARQRKTPSGET